MCFPRFPAKRRTEICRKRLATIMSFIKRMFSKWSGWGWTVIAFPFPGHGYCRRARGESMTRAWISTKDWWTSYWKMILPPTWLCTIGIYPMNCKHWAVGWIGIQPSGLENMRSFYSRNSRIACRSLPRLTNQLPLIWGMPRGFSRLGSKARRLGNKPIIIY